MRLQELLDITVTDQQIILCNNKGMRIKIFINNDKDRELIKKYEKQEVIEQEVISNDSLLIYIKL
jgi:hypothetical protein